MSKFVLKYQCLGCSTMFEKKQAHGCLNETKWKRLKRRKSKTK